MWRTSAGPPMSEKRAISIWLAPGLGASAMWKSTMHSVTDEPRGGELLVAPRAHELVRPADRSSERHRCVTVVHAVDGTAYSIACK